MRGAGMKKVLIANPCGAVADLAGPDSPIARLLGGTVLDPLEELLAPTGDERFRVPPILNQDHSDRGAAASAGRR